MTPKRRFLSGLFGGRTDRTPVGNPTSIATKELMEMTGAFFPEAHLEPQTMASLAAAGHEILGYDTIMPYFGVQQEAAALGCEVDWGSPDMMPDAKTHPWDSADDIEVPPGFLEHPATRCILEAISILRHQYGDRVAIVGKVFGPWTLAYHTFGVQNFLMKIILEPDDVRRILDRLKDVTILYGKAQIDAGADVLCLPDHVTGDLVGPHVYRDFLLPVHKVLTQEIGCPLILHCCGSTLDRLEYFVAAGFDCYHFESKVDARQAKALVGNRMSLIGNVNNPETLLQGTPEDVKRESRYALEAGVEILAPECAVPTATPNANLAAIVEVAKEGARTTVAAPS
jgi:MtaA/CmuA family methyltransferase